MARAKKSTWGGRRPGTGSRPRLGSKPAVARHWRISPEMEADLIDLCPFVGRHVIGIPDPATRSDVGREAMKIGIAELKRRREALQSANRGA